MPPGPARTGALHCPQCTCATRALALRRTRIDRLVEKRTGTDVAPGSDVTAAALRVYAQLELNGKSTGLDSLRRNPGRRFDMTARKKPDAGIGTAQGIVAHVQSKRPRIAGPFVWTGDEP